MKKYICFFQIYIIFIWKKPVVTILLVRCNIKTQLKISFFENPVEVEKEKRKQREVVSHGAVWKIQFRRVRIV